MEASTLQAPATLAQPRVLVATPLLRIRSDEQLVALFRAGYDEAFRAIHDRYHKRLFAYARQMLPGRQDAEDALQDVFVRAYSGLRASDRDLALRAWLFRVAHNRCIDELRRPAPPPPEVLQLVRSSVHDPVAEADTRESLRRLIADVRRLPDQQRSALLLRELGGMSYAELATSLGISVGAVKSVLVRARIALAQAADARDTACVEIREELAGAHDRGVRPNANSRRHMRDCSGCRGYRRELRGVTRQLAGLSPALGPLGVLAKVLGFSSGGATASGATAGGATAGGAAVAGGTGLVASGGGVALGAGHVATLIAAAVATAGGAVEIQHTISARPHPAARVHVASKPHSRYPGLGAQPVAPAAYGVAAGSSSAAAAAEAANPIAVKTPGPLLGHRNAVKNKPHQSPPSGSGGGAMIGTTTSTPASAGGAGTGTCLPSDPTLTCDATTSGTGGSSGSSSSTTASTSGTGSNGSSSGSTTPGASGSGSGSGSGSTMNTTNNGSSPSGSSSGTSSSGSGTTSPGTSSGSASTGSGSGTTSSGSTATVPPK